MIIAVEFRLPEEREEFVETFMGPEAFSAIRELDEKMRRILKDTDSDEDFKVVVELRQFLLDTCNELGISQEVWP